MPCTASLANDSMSLFFASLSIPTQMQINLNHYLILAQPLLGPSPHPTLTLIYRYFHEHILVSIVSICPSTNPKPNVKNTLLWPLVWNPPGSTSNNGSTLQIFGWGGPFLDGRFHQEWCLISVSFSINQFNTSYHIDMM